MGKRQEKACFLLYLGLAHIKIYFIINQIECFLEDTRECSRPLSAAFWTAVHSVAIDVVRNNSLGATETLVVRLLRSLLLRNTAERICVAGCRWDLSRLLHGGNAFLTCQILLGVASFDFYGTTVDTVRLIMFIDSHQEDIAATYR